MSPIPLSNTHKTMKSMFNVTFIMFSVIKCASNAKNSVWKSGKVIFNFRNLSLAGRRPTFGLGLDTHFRHVRIIFYFLPSCWWLLCYYLSEFDILGPPAQTWADQLLFYTLNMKVIHSNIIVISSFITVVSVRTVNITSNEGCAQIASKKVWNWPKTHLYCQILHQPTYIYHRCFAGMCHNHNHFNECLTEYRADIARIHGEMATRKTMWPFWILLEELTPNS